VDPKQTLLNAERHLVAGELVDAASRLADYRTWRQSGGFEPVGGDELARELERRLAAASDMTSNIRTYRSCGWCHALNPATERYCKDCGHEAHVSRMECRCPRCTRVPEPIAEQDVEAVLAELRRRQSETSSTAGDTSMNTADDAARVLYLRHFKAAFEKVAGKPLPEGFEGAEIEAYRQRGVPPADAALDFLDTYWQGGRLLP
jgi:hypothetical protein